MARKGKRKVHVQAEVADSEIDYRKGASVKAINTFEDIGGDSEDEFHQQRESISLGGASLYDRKDDSDAGSEVEVMGLDVQDSDMESEPDYDEVDDEDDEDDPDEQLLDKIRRNLKQPEMVDDILDTRDKDEEIDPRSWGRSRRSFYDGEDDLDDDIAKEEEIEALRMRKERLDEMGEEDYIDDLEDSLARRVKGEAGMKAETLVPVSTDDFDHLNINGGLFGSSTPQVEVLDKGLSTLSPDKLAEIVRNTEPEIIHLLEEFRERWEELHLVIGPAVKFCYGHVETHGDSLLSASLSYLRLKYRLLLVYLTNVAFYLAYRANPPPAVDAKQHPVVDTLVTLREMLEKIESEVEGKVNDDDAADAGSKKKSKKGKRAQNKAKGMVKLMAGVHLLVEGGLESDGDDDGDDDASLGVDDAEADEDFEDPEDSTHRIESQTRTTSKASKKPKKGKDKDKAAARFADHTDDANDVPEVEFVKLGGKNMLEKKKKKANKAAISDFGEDRELDDVDILDKEEKRRSLRFHVTRIDQAISKSQKRLRSGDEDIPLRDRFGRVVQSAKPEPSKGEDSKKDRRRGADLSDLDPLDSERPENNKRGRDEDLEFDPNDINIGDDLMDEMMELHEEYDRGDDADKKSSERKSGRGRSSGDKDDALEYYTSVQKSKRAKKEERETAVMDMKQRDLENRYYENDSVGEGEKRHINFTILKNKGLTPSRPKANRNPRVKRRLKYEAAVKKLPSYRRVAADKSKLGAYAGESTGIKANTSRSVRFV
ncbi:Sas10 C-terminal domain-containing protein [Polychytrium aggregatum]|uniref:Sas10 C-terminal domain-containing protein n=1 Tax=Polychytrium aggregatum TaxID=110093 RepID=UPI0022FE81D0|nr:Sas10 C-terminal domain-containing protein [Polychytrium aggregatum]KAI9209072.1 Sas10 C-terminal domain-containing protein [Polychytrium aggregatum]